MASAWDPLRRWPLFTSFTLPYRSLSLEKRGFIRTGLHTGYREKARSKKVEIEEVNLRCGSNSHPLSVSSERALSNYLVGFFLLLFLLSGKKKQIGTEQSTVSACRKRGTAYPTCLPYLGGKIYVRWPENVRVGSIEKAACLGTLILSPLLLHHTCIYVCVPYHT